MTALGERLNMKHGLCQRGHVARLPRHGAAWQRWERARLRPLRGRWWPEEPWIRGFGGARSAVRVVPGELRSLGRRAAACSQKSSLFAALCAIAMVDNGSPWS